MRIRLFLFVIFVGMSSFIHAQFDTIVPKIQKTEYGAIRIDPYWRDIHLFLESGIPALGYILLENISDSVLYYKGISTSCGIYSSALTDEIDTLQPGYKMLYKSICENYPVLIERLLGHPNYYNPNYRQIIDSLSPSVIFATKGLCYDFWLKYYNTDSCKYVEAYFCTNVQMYLKKEYLSGYGISYYGISNDLPSKKREE